MTINATLLGELLSVLAILFATLGYWLGKRKTSTPLLMALLAFIGAFIPPLGLIFLASLALKQDVRSTTDNYGQG